MADFNENRLAPLPPEARRLLDTVAAPPRLVAHLRLVHDVADTLLGWLARHYPEVEVDAAAVRFGAATHDIGKVRVPDELTGPGHAHEPAGAELLAEHGVSEERARFCRTHAAWDAPGVELEDLLVSLADKAWKGARVSDLEDRVAAHLAEHGRSPMWRVWSDLDEVLTAIAADAEDRLLYQARHRERDTSG